MMSSKVPTKITTMNALVVLMTLSCLPGLAQQEISNNQPVTRTLSADEVRLQAKLKLDFKQGLIDSTQLAAMQRDFDGILSREDSYKTRGLTSGGVKTIAKDLTAFEHRLDRSAGVHTTKEAMDATGPKADKNNANLSSVAPTK